MPPKGKKTEAGEAPVDWKNVSPDDIPRSLLDKCEYVRFLKERANHLGNDLKNARATQEKMAKAMDRARDTLEVSDSLVVQNVALSQAGRELLGFGQKEATAEE